MKIHYYILIITILTACIQEKTKNTLEMNNEKGIELQAQYFYPKETFDVMGMNIIDKNLVITSMKSKTLIHIYDAQSLQLNASFGERGEGPNDLMLPILCGTPTDVMFLGGYDRITTFIAYSLNQGKPVMLEKFKIPQNGNPMNDMILLDSTHLIFNDIFELQIKELNLNNNQQTLLKQYKKEDHRESFFYSNKGTLASTGTSIAYAYSYKNQIDFMDLKGNIIKSVKKDERKPSITINPNNDNIYSYINICANNKYYYALYRNKTEKEFIQGQYKGDIMEVYDDEGRLIQTYTFDFSPIIYAIDKNNQRMFGFNAAKEAILIYDLP